MVVRIEHYDRLRRKPGIDHRADNVACNFVDSRHAAKVDKDFEVGHGGHPTTALLVTARIKFPSKVVTFGRSQGLFNQWTTTSIVLDYLRHCCLFFKCENLLLGMTASTDNLCCRENISRVTSVIQLLLLLLSLQNLRHFWLI